ncbi:xylulose 5-phosphate 3-epimerase [Ramlibacter sp. PS3R-8]|uniref:xylulose 5-phosphate 3-epimerase n=1 Tax=Ramlibacter sp. PS3R-8 TaxID=3133437 RepID=UPI0030B25737
MQDTHPLQHEDSLAASHAELFRQADPAFAHWAEGYGPIRHAARTQVRVHEMAQLLVTQRRTCEAANVYRVLAAADRVAAAAMWLTVHMTYASSVRCDGMPLAAEDFKRVPEGHTGGSLNMVPAYIGYLAANSLTAHTRAWVMGQGHSVAGIEACNLLVGNLLPVQAERYDTTEAGLTRFVNDFYSYALTPDGTPASPLGSHVSANTAGGISEGGYLGFTELQYVHMPLPGERLVAFLSDGAFEEQRGSDWAPRWWRAEDSGLVAPIMVLNGRRIEQRSTMQQLGGVAWLQEHLRNNGFDPIAIDGTDPAAFAWAIFTMEDRQQACAAAVQRGDMVYPAHLHYTIAEAPKGFGFPGAGTNDAHNLPLGANPRTDAQARRRFNEGTALLHVAPDELRAAVAALNLHEVQGRPREKDHILATRSVPAIVTPELPAAPSAGSLASPMDGIDAAFQAVVRRNSHLRVRVGNPDELRSNRMGGTLDILKHRVVSPEPGVSESITGSVITALNEEAVVSAALANKGGLNLVVSYEAFAAKMLGALRQEILFARHLALAGRPPKWLSVVTVATSHAWENGKNEQSHQDPTFGETLLGEMGDTSRVLFPCDWNTAQAALLAAYVTHGQFWSMVVPKRPLPVRASPAQAQRLVKDGAMMIRNDAQARVLFVAIGAYQLQEALLAADRLAARGVPVALSYVLEPGRFRMPRDSAESTVTASDAEIARLFPPEIFARVILTHTRPEPMVGLLRRLDTGPARTRTLGFISRGGTLDVNGMLFANRSTWAHAVAAAAETLGQALDSVLDPAEIDSVRGCGDPHVLFDAR